MAGKNGTEEWTKAGFGWEMRLFDQSMLDGDDEQLLR